MRGAALLERLSAAGASAQAAVPGLYVWGITVAPDAWARGSAWLAKLASVVGVLALVVGVVAGDQRSPKVRIAVLWTFILSCGVVWSAAPSGMGPGRVDALRGAAGMVGWGLFALAVAAPALQARREQQRVEEGGALMPRRAVARGDAIYLAAGVALALTLQTFGWGVASPERAILVRIVGVAAGIAVIGATTDVALARHAARSSRSRARRLRGALVPLVVVAILGLAGLVWPLFEVLR